jgi:hypothetical protein
VTSPSPRLRAWEVAGICVAVAIGAAVGAAWVLIDRVNELILGDDSSADWPNLRGLAPR